MWSVVHPEWRLVLPLLLLYSTSVPYLLYKVYRERREMTVHKDNLAHSTDEMTTVTLCWLVVFYCQTSPKYSFLGQKLSQSSGGFLGLVTIKRTALTCALLDWSSGWPLSVLFDQAHVLSLLKLGKF